MDEKMASSVNFRVSHDTCHSSSILIVYLRKLAGLGLMCFSLLRTRHELPEGIRDARTEVGPGFRQRLEELSPVGGSAREAVGEGGFRDVPAHLAADTATLAKTAGPDGHAPRDPVPRFGMPLLPALHDLFVRGGSIR